MIFRHIPVVLTQLAAASGLVSFISFAYATYKDVKMQQVNFNQSWQESEIYGIVFEGGVRGALFDDIHAELNKRIEAVRQPLGLSLEDASTESVRRALIGLTERGIIILRADYSYVVPMAPAPEAAPGASGGPDAPAVTTSDERRT